MLAGAAIPRSPWKEVRRFHKLFDDNGNVLLSDLCESQKALVAHVTAMSPEERVLFLSPRFLVRQVE